MSEKITKCKKCVTPQLRPLGVPNPEHKYIDMVSTAGFTIFPFLVALVHKKLYVDHYLSCRRFGEEPLDEGMKEVLCLESRN